MVEGWRHYLSIETSPLISPYRVSSDLHSLTQHLTSFPQPLGGGVCTDSLSCIVIVCRFHFRAHLQTLYGFVGLYPCGV